MGDARLGVESVDKRVGNALVLGAAHIRLQLTGLENGIGTSSLLEDVVDLTQQQRLVGSIGQLVHDEVLLALALAVEPRLDGNGTHIDELEDTGREQVVVVGAEITVGVEHVVGLLEIALQRDVAIPEQILVDLLACAPYIDEIPDAAHDGQDEEAKHQHDQGKDVLASHLIVTIATHIVAALEGLVHLGLEGLVYLIPRLEHTLVEAAHDIEGATTAERLGVIGHHLTVGKAELASETEAPDATVILGEAEGISLSLDGKTALIGFGSDIGIEEDVADGIGIGMRTDEAGEGVGGDIGTLATFAETPADLTAAMLGNDAALALLPAAGTVNVPAADVLELKTCFVGHREVAYLAALNKALADVALRAFGVDAHLARLGDAGITVRAQHHTDVETMKLGTGKKTCC